MNAHPQAETLRTQKETPTLPTSRQLELEIRNGTAVFYSDLLTRNVRFYMMR